MGGSSEGVVQYGSADATPQFVRLVRAYCRLYGDDILDEEFRRADGVGLTIRQSVLAAVQWTESEIGTGVRPLLGFSRTNREYGHRWQVMQDGATSIIHPDGRLANGDGRVETIGLQGLAYDCLLDGVALVGSDAPEDAERWQKRADDLRDAALENFWMPDEQYFGVAIDRDPLDGATHRLVRTLTAMPTELLETRIFDMLPEDERCRYVSGIVRMAHGPEFLTTAGIRSRALRHVGLTPYSDYHGVHTSWAVANSIYANGLERQGFNELKQDIVCRHVSALRLSQSLHEFLYVDDCGKIRHPLLKRSVHAPEDDVIYGTNWPEVDQAWTLSFVLRAFADAEQAAPERRRVTEAFQRDLTRETAQRALLRT